MNRSCLRENKAKARLADGRHVICLAGFNHPDTIERLGPLNPHAVWFEGEHGDVDPSNIGDLTRAADLAGATSIVRVNRAEKGIIYRTLDLGAQGIAVPHVNDRETAEGIVRAAKFSPIGERGMYMGRRGIADPDYFQHANADTMIVAFIEEVAALENLDEIVKVDHIDVFFVGPGDLSQSLGHLGDFEHPVVQKAVDEAVTRIVAAGRTAGTIGTLDNVQHFMALGVRFFLIGVMPFIQTGFDDFKKAGWDWMRLQNLQLSARF